MKKIYFIIWTVVVATLFVSCEKDEEARLSTISVSSETFTPSYNSVLIETRFETKAASNYKPTLKTVYVQYSTRANFEEYEEALMNGEDYSYTYTVQLSDLQDNTTYYIRYVASNRYSSAMTEEISEFKTLQPSTPIVVLDSITTILDTSAKANIHLAFDGGAPISEMGICWSTQPTPIVEDNLLKTKASLAILDITSLQPNTKYFVRAYAKNKTGICYSEELSFLTYSLPEVQTNNVENIQIRSALLSGELVFDGNDPNRKVGFCWSETPNPTIEGYHQEVSVKNGAFSYLLSELNGETRYYVRAYALNKIGVDYGEEKVFITLTAQAPSVVTKEVTNVEYFTATVLCDVSSDGGASVTERGVVYSTNQNPTIEDRKSINGSGIGVFTCNISNLQEGTTYYARAYAINKKAIVYGEQINFTTKKGAMAFSVSSSKKVYFSPGNLQYHPANNMWRFAESQFDYIGEENAYTSSTYNGWIDLFGFSGSISANFGVSTSENKYDYSGSFVDWGINKIGDDAANTWRTLTYQEWKYIIETRPNYSSLYGIAQVDGVNGLILLPDGWLCPDGINFKPGFYNAEWGSYWTEHQTFSAYQWSLLEESGAIFLVAASCRWGTFVSNDNSSGYYHAAPGGLSGDAYYYLSIGDTWVQMNQSYSPDCGISVRLVKDMNK